MSVDRLVRLGRIVNGYSNQLAMLAIDAAHVGAWGGPHNGGEGDDYARATSALSEHRHAIGVGEGQGLVVQIGGCGISYVHRVGDVLVLVEHFVGDDDADTEAELDAAIVSTPSTSPTKIGTVDVDSGVLALVSLVEQATTLTAAERTAVAQHGTADTGYGMLVALPKGRYEVWREWLGDIEGAWGVINGRVRIVPAGTRVVAGEPIAVLAPAPAPRVATAAGRRIVGGWTAVAGMAVAGDGRAFARDTSGRRVCGWDTDGALRWHRLLVDVRDATASGGALSLQLVGAELLVLLPPVPGVEGQRIRAFDPATGTIRRELVVPAHTRSFAVSPDRTKLVLRVAHATSVLSYPHGRPLARFAQRCTENWIAIDDRWLAVAGHEVHVFDLAVLRHVTTFEPPRTPWCGCFTADQRLATGDDAARIRIWDPASGEQLADLDAAGDRGRKPTVTAIAASRHHLAAARNDGTVVLLDSNYQPIYCYEKHEATSRSAIAFSHDGTALWVNAALKEEPVGLSVYNL